MPVLEAQDVVGGPASPGPLEGGSHLGLGEGVPGSGQSLAAGRSTDVYTVNIQYTVRIYWVPAVCRVMCWAALEPSRDPDRPGLPSRSPQSIQWKRQTRNQINICLNVRL